ncbi:hypothetical protein BDZ91DRAFT_358764 [Kalaharituber pfeilii]|nr:hypothetical protein BDZ91DRAFT_358764 [Kalaharituber pfeilii]
MPKYMWGPRISCVMRGLSNPLVGVQRRWYNRSQLVTYNVRWNPLWNSMQVTHESLKTPLYRHRDILFGTTEV